MPLLYHCKVLDTGITSEKMVRAHTTLVLASIGTVFKYQYFEKIKEK